MGRSSVTSFVAWWGSSLRVGGGAEECVLPLPLLDVADSKEQTTAKAKYRDLSTAPRTVKLSVGFGRDDVGLGVSDEPCWVAEEVPHRLKPHC